jgi:hypothetical protein
VSDWDEDPDEDSAEGGGVFEPEHGLAVWVQADKCTTCVFWPGNRMSLSPGRLAQLTRTAVEKESHVTCHDTLLYGYTTRSRPAVCRGYFDHPQGNEHSLALRTGRALGTLHYQLPTKEPSMLLADLVANTGMSMRLKRGEVQRHSTGWTSREWKVTYVVDGRTLRTTFRLGNPDEDPTFLECLTQSLEVARRVKSAASYEEWAEEMGGADPAQWSPRTVYAQQVRATLRLEDFLGDMAGVYLEAHGTNTSDHQDQAPANLDALLPPGEVARPALEGVQWMIPDCLHAHASDTGQLCDWRVLAVHRDRVRLAGLVQETEHGYRAVTWDGHGREVRHQERPFREMCIATVTRAYDPTRHDTE